MLNVPDDAERRLNRWKYVYPSNMPRVFHSLYLALRPNAGWGVMWEIGIIFSHSDSRVILRKAMSEFYPKFWHIFPHNCCTWFLYNLLLEDKKMKCVSDPSESSVNVTLNAEILQKGVPIQEGDYVMYYGALTEYVTHYAIVKRTPKWCMGKVTDEPIVCESKWGIGGDVYFHELDNVPYSYGNRYIVLRPHARLHYNFTVWRVPDPEEKEFKAYEDSLPRYTLWGRIRNLIGNF